MSSFTGTAASRSAGGSAPAGDGAPGGGVELCVVVPTWCEAERIAGLVERLLGPSPGGDARDRADRVVVADGGSRDGTVAAARAAGAETLEAPLGRGSQLAHGARRVLETTGARVDPSALVLLFLHADMRPGPGALAAVRRAFEAEPELVATAMRQRIAARGAIYRAIERAADWRVRLLGLVWGDSGLAVRASSYTQCGGFRPLPIFEDLDLARRLRRRGRPRWIGEAELEVSARRWQRDGPLRRTLGNWMLTLAYLAGVSPETLARRYPPEPPPSSSRVTT